MDKVSNEVRHYIENEVFPIYKKNDYGHNINHIMYVINRSLAFASSVEGINYDMVYVIASYHDIAHHIDPKNHEKVSAEILYNDKKLRDFFTEEQIEIMKEAVEDHRASLKKEPRSVYGKIVSSADRNVMVELVLKRTYMYRITNCSTSTLEEIIEDARDHVISKFGTKGYASEKMYFEDSDYKHFLEECTRLSSNKEEFRKSFIEVNGINNVEENMIFLFNELKRCHNEYSIDELIYYVYIKLNTTLPFEEVKKKLLEYNKGILKLKR